jgi:hypothetical protein
MVMNEKEKPETPRENERKEPENFLAIGFTMERTDDS